jgi:hypothetical protein
MGKRADVPLSLVGLHRQYLCFCTSKASKLVVKQVKWVPRRHLRHQRGELPVDVYRD